MRDSQKTVQKVIFEFKDRPQKVFKNAEAYSEPSRTSKMQFLAKTVSR